MTTTMEWLTTQKLIPDFQWIAGKGGKDNIITGVNIMDNPDTIRFLIGGELILSTGYFLINDEHLRQNFIRELTEKKCAGLGITLKRYLNELPQSMIDEANRLDFPIISIPVEQNFSEISMLVYRRILKEEMADTESVYKMYRKLNEIIIHEHSLRDTMDTIYELIGCPVMLIDKNLDLLEQSLPVSQGISLVQDQFILDLKKDETMIDFYNKGHFKVIKKSNGILFPIQDKDNLLGFLFVSDTLNGFTSDKYNFIFSILSLLAIELVNNTLKQQSTLQKEQNFINSILFANLTETELASQCNLYGFDYSRPRICAVLRLEPETDQQNEKKGSVRERLDFLIRGQITHSSQFIYKFNYEGNIILLFLANSTDIHNAETTSLEFIRHLSSLMDAQHFTYNIGISECLQGIHTVRSSFLEAIDALQLGKKVHPGEHIFQYKEDIIYHTMANSMSCQHLKNFYINALKPLIDFDNKNNTSLFETLRMYFKCGFSIKETSNALYIHRNTMTSRLEKIKELLPYNLSSINDYTLLMLSFYVYELEE